jgi:hypothetical protein
LAASVSLAQEPSSPPLVPGPEAEQAPMPAAPPPAPGAPAPPPVDPYVAPTFWQRCFAVPAQAWVPGPGGRFMLVGGGTASAPAPGGSNFHAATPVGAAPPAREPSGSSGGSSGGGMDGKALLVLAVIAVAALPIVLYVLDSDAPAVVEQRFHCPSFGLEGYGGVDVGAIVGGVAPTGTGRFTFGWSYFGSNVEFSLSGGSIDAFAAHLLLRIAPKNHIEPNLAFGYRLLGLRGAVRQGLEVGVPHRYVFWRDSVRQFSLELRPSFIFGLGTFDVGLEAAVLIPLFEPLHLRAGGRVQSFGEDVIGGFNLGLSFHL